METILWAIRDHPFVHRLRHLFVLFVDSFSQLSVPFVVGVHQAAVYFWIAFWWLGIFS
jgi:hypothetical protein